MGNPGRRAVLVALWRMSRPAQLALIALVYALGVAMALGRGGTADPRAVGLGLAALLPVAASVHYANEYADVETDARTERTPFSGGSGALVESGLSSRLALRAAVAAGLFGLAVLGSAVTPTADRALSGVPAALLLGVLVVGWQYSVGPLRLAWNGLGEVTNAALGGVALPLYGVAVVTGDVAPGAALATVPFALVVFVNLLETQWPDRRADAAVGKRTLATRWSAGRLRAAYAAGSLAAAGSAVVLAGRVLPPPVAVGTLAPMVGLAPGTHRFTRREEPLPAVATMVAVAVGTTLGWAVVAGLR
ncbi:1,4-dihydroxy-2-naphthoate octaprenyltransferase [Halorubrum sp. Ea1]|uniref:prenyltransferase n=1 Tax=Halorubrum sp. Ea1 TaxID=1480718 RepID=UPI000BD092CA|nr:prenyltransferase [Halorubrum sp. Ea1]OYR53299.1 1,4-dihydroxy-2-naphthoate octaprenyltransferase [Halorubrum sp. Ea1]